MLHQPEEIQGVGSNSATDWLRRTSTKILKIGAGLREFLHWTEKIVFTSEPSHEPDPKFVEELVDILQGIDKK